MTKIFIQQKTTYKSLQLKDCCEYYLIHSIKNTDNSLELKDWCEYHLIHSIKNTDNSLVLKEQCEDYLLLLCIFCLSSICYRSSHSQA